MEMVPSKIQKRTRTPTCTLCQNHGISSPLKGHKYDCEYSNCECRLCDQGRQRREVMRRQVKLRRDQMRKYDSATSHVGSKDGGIQCDTSPQRMAPAKYFQKPQPAQASHHSIRMGCPYARLPPRAFSYHPNKEPFANYFNMPPLLPGMPSSPKNSSPTHRISPVIAGRLSVSDNSAFVAFKSRVNTIHWSPCDVDDSNEAAYTLAALQHRNTLRLK